ncbi:MAG: guanylate kinase [Acholeplasmataceae bacterium]
MIVLVGASASGKTEVARRLLKDYGYRKVVTTTTREPRENERDGVDYHFITRERFEKLREQSAFVEVTHYGGHLYGIQKKDIDRYGVVIVDPNGANALALVLDKDAFIVLIETAEGIRERRMLRRGDSGTVTKMRLDLDRSHFRMENFTRIDRVLNNDLISLEDLTLEIHESYQKFLNGMT